jgi:hypothetical protein
LEDSVEYRRDEDKLIGARILNSFKRVWIDLLVLSVMFGLSFMLPDTPDEAKRAGSQLNLLALFITKTNSILWGWLIIDVVRKWKWPYLDIQIMLQEKNYAGVYFLLGIYMVVIYSFAVGG